MNTRAPLLATMLLVLVTTASRAAEITVGSKKFTESVLLGEMVKLLAEAGGAKADHRSELGGSRILWEALVSGQLDVYPEYTGTLREELLKGEPDLAAALTRRGLRMSRSLGFNDTYALGMKEELADKLGIRTISDLRNHPQLQLGFSDEFIHREDGWPRLRQVYGLEQVPRGLDHDLAYRGIDQGGLQVIDLYSTDAEIKYHHLRVLADDRKVFPEYEAVLLYRAELEQRAPEALESILRLEGRINEARMAELNGQAKLEHRGETTVAAAFLRDTLGVDVHVAVESVPQTLLRLTGEQLALTGISLAAAIALALPLGILAARRPRLGQLLFAGVGVIQTIPSLALLVFLIPLMGIGWKPALVALFLYSLLPILRNTSAGLRDIPLSLRESAEALGLPPPARLRLVELPLASRSILAGIKTSAVLNVGTATLGAIIGAGGYGQPILTGIRLDDTALILEGAVPAALLALIVQGGFELAERVVIPRGLRL